MEPIDNEKFGRFVAALRRAKGLTQLELGERLFVSDKTVSKWERGQSMPNVDLLLPLAEALGVSMTELLRGERIAPAQKLDNDEVEHLVTTSLDLSAQSALHKNKRRWGLVFGLAAALVLAELAIILALGVPAAALDTSLLLVSGLMLIFGGWFCCFAPEMLPRYYDENKISAFSQGAFRMNMIGVHFNNGNWPHICQALRIYTLAVAVAYPPIWLAIEFFAAPDIAHTARGVLMFPLVFGMLAPIYYLGRKYE